MADTGKPGSASFAARKQKQREERAEKLARIKRREEARKRAGSTN